VFSGLTLIRLSQTVPVTIASQNELLVYGLRPSVFCDMAERMQSGPIRAGAVGQFWSNAPEAAGVLVQAFSHVKKLAMPNCGPLMIRERWDRYAYWFFEPKIGRVTTVCPWSASTWYPALIAVQLVVAVHCPTTGPALQFAKVALV
jgi:hypothetical protein